VKQIRLNVNGSSYEVEVNDNERLVDVLRDKLGFKGVKEGCGVGDCGLCIVLVNGRPVNSCLVLAARLDGEDILTVEGLGSAENLHPLQRSYIEVGASQCGYCIPAALLVTHSLLSKNKRPSADEMRRHMRSVLCRCGSYLRFEEAVKVVVGDE
jgi:aerobic-type carbon monoxide dehydrogenase small subunit (CoxS/CutS family)